VPRAQTALAAANEQLAAAHKRVSEVRERQRSIQLEGESVAGAISQTLYEAGRDGGEPDVAELRAKIAALQTAMQDLSRVAEGAQANVLAAQHQVAAVRFEFAPQFERDLLDQAEKLAAERARAEAVLAQVAGREADLRAEWRRLAASVPGGDDPPFADGATIPTRLPCESHAGIFAFVPQPEWPGWFLQAVAAAKKAYDPNRRRDEVPA
jgi:chromosome segregation ATPase